MEKTNKIIAKVEGDQFTWDCNAPAPLVLVIVVKTIQSAVKVFKDIDDKTFSNILLQTLSDTVKNEIGEIK